jgi:F-type H+-transporting ATPase subunit alpha
MRKVAGKLKLELSQYRDLEAFAQFGSDLDPDTQRTLARGARLVKSLNQNEGQPLAVEEQVAVIYAATNGYVDRINEDRVTEFHANLIDRLRSSASEALEKIAGGEWSDEVQKQLDEAIAQFAEDFGYDLDEEGQPLSEDTEDAATARARGGRDEREESAESEEREEETAGAAA